MAIGNALAKSGTMSLKSDRIEAFYEEKDKDAMDIKIVKAHQNVKVKDKSVIETKKCRNAIKKSEGPFAIVVNSGNSNAFTGMAGFLAVENICSKFSTILKIRAENIYTASTGVIGEPLNWQKIVDVASSLKKNLSGAGIKGAAKAIMTTDTFAKGSFREFKIDKDLIRIGGIAKGSGMIAPDMATMLVYIFTDAQIEQALLEAVVSELNEETFNSITVDGDTSCLLYTSPSPRDATLSRMPSSA